MYQINVLDSFGNRARVVNGVTATYVEGVTGLSFSPAGATLGKAGSLTFEASRSLARNLALGPGVAVQLVHSTMGVLGTYLVDDQGEQVADDHRARYDCLDLTRELAWQLVPGFVTLDGEALATTVRRVLALATEMPWQATVDIDGFAGVPFAADGISVQSAVAKLANERFCNWRLGLPTDNGGRGLRFGRMGNPTGIRLSMPSGRPTAMLSPSVRPITALTVTQNALTVTNCLVAAGSGTGEAQLTLGDLFGEMPVAWAAGPRPGWQVATGIAFPYYDPAYPVYRRIRYDGGGADGYQYFLADLGSIGRWRERWGGMNRSEISTIGKAPADLEAAATALYQLTMAELRVRSVRTTVLDVTTVARGSNIGVAGDTVKVYFKRSTDGRDPLSLNTDYKVLDVVTSVDTATGTGLDHWTLSTTGRGTETLGEQIGGLEGRLDYMTTVPAIYPTRESIWVKDYVDANHPINVPIDGDAGVLRTVECTFTVSLLPALSPVTGGKVDGHAHAVTIPAQTVDASVPTLNERAANPGNQAQYLHLAPAAQNPHGHADSIIAYRGGYVAENIVPGRSGNVSKSGNASKTGAASKSGAADKTGAAAKSGSATKGGKASKSGSAAKGGNASKTGYASKGGGASKSGGASKGGQASKTGYASKTGSVSSNNVSGLDVHQHGMFIQGAGTPGTLDAGGFVYVTTNDAQLRATGYKQTIARTNQPDQQPTNHGHSDNVGVNDQIGVSDTISVADNIGVSDTIRVDDSIGVADTIRVDDSIGVSDTIRVDDGIRVDDSIAVRDQIGVSDSIGVNDQIGVADAITIGRSGRLVDALDVAKAGSVTNNQTGFTPYTNQHEGFTPNTNFPGYANLQTKAQTVQTSSTVAPGFTPVYGYFQDPTGKASGVYVYINGAGYGPFNTDFTLTVTANLKQSEGNIAQFTSATFGMMLIRARIRRRESTVRVAL